MLAKTCNGGELNICWQIDRQIRQPGASGRLRPRREATRIGQEEPGPVGAVKRGLHPLPVEPSLDGQGIVFSSDAANVGVCAPPQSVSGPGQHAAPARSSSADDNVGTGFCADRFNSEDIAGIARMGKGFPLDSKSLLYAGAADLSQSFLGHLRADQPSSDRCSAELGQTHGSLKSFQCGSFQRSIGFGMC